MGSPQAFLGLLQLFTFALLCHLVSSQDYWPYGNKKTKKVECQRAAFHPGKTWDQNKYIYGGGKCWKNGGYDYPCLYVQTNEIKMPSYFKTDRGRHSFKFRKTDGSGHEECVAACLKHTGCQFITIGWFTWRGSNKVVTSHYCRMYKILWSSTKLRNKMTADHQDLITVRDNCKLKDAPGPKPTPKPMPKPTPMAKPAKTVDTKECCSGVKCNGYRGTKATTEYGRTCQAWNTQSPHRHGLTPQRNTNAGLDKNYCRNPDGEPGGAWCYTTDQGKRWEYCGIPKTCPAECCSGVKCNGYRGFKATTGTGRTCQAWNKHTPHRHPGLTPTKKPNSGLDKNYCRNPDGEPGGAWCYTMDKGKRWEYCGIQNC